MGIVESRDKGFVLDLKLLFTIVNCFSGKFPPIFFTMKLVGFIGFPRLSYLVLFIFPLYDFDMILMFICLFLQVLFLINLINNLSLKLVNSINRDLNFSTLLNMIILIIIQNFWRWNSSSESEGNNLFYFTWSQTSSGKCFFLLVMF